MLLETNAIIVKKKTSVFPAVPNNLLKTLTKK